MAAKEKRGRGRPAKITIGQVALIQMKTEMVDGEPPDKERSVRRVCLHLCGGDVARARALAMAYMRARRSLTASIERLVAEFNADRRRK